LYPVQQGPCYYTQIDDFFKGEAVRILIDMTSSEYGEYYLPLLDCKMSTADYKDPNEFVPLVSQVAALTDQRNKSTGTSSGMPGRKETRCNTGQWRLRDDTMKKVARFDGV
jgi:hypothetical protein